MGGEVDNYPTFHCLSHITGTASLVAQSAAGVSHLITMLG